MLMLLLWLLLMQPLNRRVESRDSDSLKSGRMSMTIDTRWHRSVGMSIQAATENSRCPCTLNGFNYEQIQLTIIWAECENERQTERGDE